MAILIYVIVISLVIVALVQFGLPAYYRANQKLEGVKTLDSSSSLRTIILALILPLSIGFSFAFMAAKIAACGGWLNPGFIIGLVAGILLSIVFIQLIPKVFKAESKVIVGGALVVSLMVALSSFFYSPALDNFNSVDAYHHPIYEPVGIEVVNSVISFLGNAFPMEDYPVIHSDNTIYSPESSFINTFTNITNLCYLIVSFVSLYAIVTGPFKREKEKILKKIEALEKGFINKEAAVVLSLFLFFAFNGHLNHYIIFAKHKVKYMKVINKKRRFMNYKQRMKNRRWINIMITVLEPGQKVIYGEESI